MHKKGIIMDTAAQSPVALGALHALAQLLHCADPARWASVARPAPADLAGLLFLIHGDLAASLDAAEPFAAERA